MSRAHQLFPSQATLHSARARRPSQFFDPTKGHPLNLLCLLCLELIPNPNAESARVLSEHAPAQRASTIKCFDPATGHPLSLLCLQCLERIPTRTLILRACSPSMPHPSAHRLPTVFDPTTGHPLSLALSTLPRTYNLTSLTRALPVWPSPTQRNF